MPGPNNDTLRRPWWSLDLPAVLVACAFVLTVEGIVAVAWYRRQVAQIPEIGRAAPVTVTDGGDEGDDGPAAGTTHEVRMDGRPVDEKDPRTDRGEDHE